MLRKGALQQTSVLGTAETQAKNRYTLIGGTASTSSTVFADESANQSVARWLRETVVPGSTKNRFSIAHESDQHMYAILQLLDGVS